MQSTVRVAPFIRSIYPLNPTAPGVEEDSAFASFADLPVVPESPSIVTPPHVTREVNQQAIAAGVKNVWMQPGAEVVRAVRRVVRVAVCGSAICSKALPTAATENAGRAFYT